MERKCRGGTEVPVKIICDVNENIWFEKAFRPFCMRDIFFEVANRDFFAFKLVFAP